MGMFDTVEFECPRCGTAISVQSKAGECALMSIDPMVTPLSIAGDLIGETVHCASNDCDFVGEITQALSQGTVALGLL